MIVAEEIPNNFPKFSAQCLVYIGEFKKCWVNNLFYVYLFVSFFALSFFPFVFLSLTTKKLKKRVLKILGILGWIYFALSIAGSLVAVKYPQTGTLISISGIVQERIVEKIKPFVEKGIEVNESNQVELLESYRN